MWCSTTLRQSQRLDKSLKPKLDIVNVPTEATSSFYIWERQAPTSLPRDRQSFGSSCEDHSKHFVDVLGRHDETENAVFPESYYPD